MGSIEPIVQDMNEDMVVYTASHKGGTVFTLEPHDGVCLPQPHMVIGGSRVGTEVDAVQWLVSYTERKTNQEQK